MILGSKFLSVENGGTIHVKPDYASYSHRTLNCPDPVVESPDFTLEERKKAYFKAVAMPNTYPLNIKEVYFLFRNGWKYNLLLVAITSFIRYPFIRIKFFWFKVKRRLRLP